MDLTDRFAFNMITRPTNRQLMPNFFGDLDESSTATPKKEGLNLNIYPRTAAFILCYYTT